MSASGKGCFLCLYCGKYISVSVWVKHQLSHLPKLVVKDIENKRPKLERGV